MYRVERFSAPLPNTRGFIAGNRRGACGPPLMSQHPNSLEEIFEAHLQTLSLALWPGTVQGYRSPVRRFLAYLRTTFPRVRRLSQLRPVAHLLN
jgi:hypothetical protein